MHSKTAIVLKDNALYQQKPFRTTFVYVTTSCDKGDRLLRLILVRSTCALQILSSRGSQDSFCSMNECSMLTGVRMFRQDINGRERIHMQPMRYLTYPD